MKKILGLFLISASAFGQATNPQNTYVSSVLTNSPSLYLNYNDPTTAFQDQISGANFVGTGVSSAKTGTSCSNAVNGSPATTTTCAFTATAGDTAVLFAHPQTQTISSMVDSGGATCTQAILNANGSGMSTWVCPNLSAGSHTFTMTVAAGNAYLILQGVDVVGAATVSPVDATTAYFNTSSSATTFSSNPVTTVSPGDQLVGWVWGNNATYSLTSGFVVANGGAWVGIFPASRGTLTTGSYAFAGNMSTSAYSAVLIAIKPASVGSSPSPQQAGFDNTNNSNYSAAFSYNQVAASPNNTLGAIEWSSPASIMVQVDRLNWSRTGQIVLASKGDVGSTANNYWELTLSMSGSNSVLCYTRNSKATPNTNGAPAIITQAICSNTSIDLMPNGFNYNIMVLEDASGAVSGIAIYLNGVLAPAAGAGSVGFGSAVVNASGGTGYATATPFIGVGGGANCALAGQMNSTGGVPNTSSGFTFTKNYGCTSTPSITFNYSVISPMAIGQTCSVQLSLSATTANCSVSSVTAGSTLLISGLPNDTTGVTDSAGTPVLYGTTPTGQGPIYYEANVTAGTHTITFTTTSTHTVFYYMQTLEIAGAAPTSPIDAAAYATGTGTAVNAGSVTTTGTNELVVALMQVQSTGGSGWTAPTSGFTRCIVPGNTYNCAQAQAVTTGAYPFTVTQSSSAGWQTQLVALKPGTTTYAPTGTGVTLTYGLTGATMNSTSYPLMVPGFVSGGTFNGISQTTSTQPTTYIDEFAEFPSALSFGQLSNIYYQTKFHQSLLGAKPANPIQFIFDDDGANDLDDFWALQSSVALQNLRYLNIAGAVQENQYTCDVALFRQMLDQAGLANIPVGTVGALTSGTGGNACTLSGINTVNASTLAQVSGYPSAATVYRTVLANNPTTAVDILEGGPIVGLYQFLTSGADSISPLTGLQLWAQDVANGGALLEQCCFQGLPDSRIAYIINNLQGMPVYFMGGTPSNTGPGPLYTRVATDPMWLASAAAGTDVRFGWDSLAATYLVTPEFSNGVTVFFNNNAVSLAVTAGGTGYASQTVFKLTGANAGCNVTGTIPATSGVMQTSGIAYMTNGNCNSAPTGITLTAPTGTGATFSYAFSGTVGSGFANSTPFTLSGGGTSCTGSGFLTASGGVPSGVTTTWGTDPNTIGASYAQWGLGSGCTSSPTVTLIGSTGTGATLTATPTLQCVTLTVVGGNNYAYSTGCGNAYPVFQNQYAAGAGISPIFTMFMNSLIDPPPNGAPKVVTQ